VSAAVKKPALLAVLFFLAVGPGAVTGGRPGPAPDPSAPASAPPKSPALEFTAPQPDAPCYRIRFPFEVKTRVVRVGDLSLNGNRVRSFLIFSQGKPVPPASGLEPGVYDVVIDYAWSGGKSYAASLQYLPEGGSKPRRSEVKGVSPREGGIPGGEEGFYRLYTIEEPAGLERRDETAALTVTAPRDVLEGAGLIIFDGGRAVPFEVVESGEPAPSEKGGAGRPATVSLKIILQLSAAPRERRPLLVLKGESPAQPAGNVRLTGEGLGKTVSTPHLTIELSPKSGQVNTLEASDPAVRISNTVGVIHWNPDVFVQGLAWDHSFDWNPPASFAERTGRLVYVNSRKGPLPRIPGVRLEVKYTVEAGTPYFISETRLDFEKDLGVIAVRNDEMVVDRELFDSLIYKDKDGGLVSLPLKEREGLPNGLVHCAPADLDWVGLVNTAEGHGFFSLRINAADGNFEVPGLFPLKAGTCFYAPSDGSYVYWVRPLVYTWADYFTNTLDAFVPKGSFYYEKNAYGVWRVTDDLAPMLDELVLKLRKPLRVY
jgi:hypothetical protein